MVQILFFLSMLCVTAMLLKLFWYLDDSHEEEMRINILNYRKRFLHTSINTGYRMPISRTPVIRKPVRFYDVGSTLDTYDVIVSDNQNECA